MRKKIFGGIAVLAIAATMAVSANFSVKNNNLSNTSLANVEALAGGNEFDDPVYYVTHYDWYFTCLGGGYLPCGSPDGVWMWDGL